MLNRLDVLAETQGFGLPAEKLGRLSGLGRGVVPDWLAGNRALSWAAQFRLAEVLNGLTQLRFISAVPEEFEDDDAVAAVLARFRVSMDNTDAERIARVIREAGEADGE